MIIKEKDDKTTKRRILHLIENHLQLWKHVANTTDNNPLDIPNGTNTVLVVGKGGMTLYYNSTPHRPFWETAGVGIRCYDKLSSGRCGTYDYDNAVRYINNI
jgi:hypothetical protein